MMKVTDINESPITTITNMNGLTGSEYNILTFKLENRC